MAKIEHCMACGAYYNGSAFRECPYCKGSGKREARSNEKGGIFHLLRNTVRPTGNTAPTEPEEVLREVPEIPETDELEEVCGDTVQTAGITDGIAVGITEGVMTEGLTESVTGALTESVTGALTEGLTEPVTQAQDDFRAALKRQIRENGQTVGRYVGEENVLPVAGWLVCLKGSCLGRSFPIHKGRNRIGRSESMEICLRGEMTVSRNSMAAISFDPRSEQFVISEGESDLLTYINGSMLCGRQQLAAGDRLEFGDSDANEYMFVPFCGTYFHYRDYPMEKDAQDE